MHKNHGLKSMFVVCPGISGDRLRVIRGVFQGFLGFGPSSVLGFCIAPVF